MTAMSWICARTASPQAVLATLAITGILSAALAWRTHRFETRANRRACAIELKIAKIARNIQALRDESECRWIMQRMYATDRDKADAVYGVRKEDYGQGGQAPN